MEKMDLHRTVTGDRLAGPLESARTLWERTRGLLGREGLGPGAGMIIWECNSVHTFFMKFPIDVVFVDGAMRVVKIAACLNPWRIAWAFRASAAIELGAGASAAAGIVVGDGLEIRPAAPMI